MKKIRTPLFLLRVTLYTDQSNFKLDIQKIIVSLRKIQPMNILIK